MGKSIRIDSRCRIVMKNFDSVPQLQRFSYVHHCAARSRHDSHSRQCRHSLLQRQLAALCCNAGRPVMASVDWPSSFRTRVYPPVELWHKLETDCAIVNGLVSDLLHVDIEIFYVALHYKYILQQKLRKTTHKSSAQRYARGCA